MDFLSAVNNSSGPVTMSWSSTGPAALSDCLLDGVDFHCSSMIDAMMGDAEVMRMLEDHVKSIARIDAESFLKSVRDFFFFGSFFFCFCFFVGCFFLSFLFFVFV